MVYRIFISLMLLIFLKSSLAATEITGAFGIKFGEPKGYAYTCKWNDAWRGTS